MNIIVWATKFIPGYGWRNRRKLFLDAWLLYISAHNSTSIWSYYIHWKNERILQTSGKVTKVYVLQIAFAVTRGGHEIISIEVKGDEDTPKSCCNHE